LTFTDDELAAEVLRTDGHPHHHWFVRLIHAFAACRDANRSLRRDLERARRTLRDLKRDET
jgi:hypothetical protein